MNVRQYDVLCIILKASESPLPPPPASLLQSDWSLRATEHPNHHGPLDGGAADGGGVGAGCMLATLPGLHGHSLGGPHPLALTGWRGKLTQVLR